MSTRIELQPGYILHARPYRDTSLLVDALTKDFGKISFVARGARKATKSNANPRHLLQPFIPLLLSWQGKSSLKTLIGVESSALSHPLKEHRLYSAMYINELLVYLLPQDDFLESTYQQYHGLLSLLGQEGADFTGSDLESCLRSFEFNLLDELGYGLNFSGDADIGVNFHWNKHYFFIQNHGFVMTENHPDIRDMSFSGQDLLSIQQRDFSQASTLKAAKTITRLALGPHLRGRKIKSRELFLRLTP